jgi:hypothetical protein
MLDKLKIEVTDQDICFDIIWKMQRFDKIYGAAKKCPKYKADYLFEYLIQCINEIKYTTERLDRYE